MGVGSGGISGWTEEVLRLTCSRSLLEAAQDLLTQEMNQSGYNLGVEEEGKSQTTLLNGEPLGTEKVTVMLRQHTGLSVTGNKYALWVTGAHAQLSGCQMRQC